MNALIIILLVFALVWIGMGSYFIWKVLTYKHDFILKRPEGNSFVAYRTKARVIKDSSGTTMWKLKRFKKELIQVPPKGALAMTRKGKFFVEGWELEDGQIQYELHPTPAGVDIASTNQKILLTSQLTKANNERFRSWKDILSQYIMPMGSLLIIGLIVVMGMIFWGDLNQPAIEARNIETQQMQIQKEIYQIMKEIKNDVQVIDEVRNKNYNLSQIPD